MNFPSVEMYQLKWCVKVMPDLQGQAVNMCCQNRALCRNHRHETPFSTDFILNSCMLMRSECTEVDA